MFIASMVCENSIVLNLYPYLYYMQNLNKYIHMTVIKIKGAYFFLIHNFKGSK